MREENKEMFDLVIIGSGPAGLSAAVYGQRAMLRELVIEKEMFSGGQIVTTERVDNLLGFYGANGYDLAMKFREHADALAVPFREGTVTKVTDRGAYKEILLEDGEVIRTEAVVIATGASHRRLGVPGEETFGGAGVSYCATCDGAFFKGKVTAVVGGGDVALEDALYLANLCEKVYLIHRRDQLRGAKILQQRVFEKENIVFLPNTEVTEICGAQAVTHIAVRNNKTDEKSNLAVSGVFLAVGMDPQGGFAEGLVQMNHGYICAGEDCRTNVPLVYAAGDIRTKYVRQIATAIADGASVIASLEADRR